MRHSYTRALAWSLHHRGLVAWLFGVFAVGSLGLAFVVGQDFFPYVDSGQMRLHVRAPEGTRIEQTEVIFARVEDAIRRVIPREDSPISWTISDCPPTASIWRSAIAPPIGNGDGEILISLNQEKHRPTPEYERKIRAMWPASSPN